MAYNKALKMISAQIEPVTNDALRRYCAASGMRNSAVVNRALKDFFGIDTLPTPQQVGEAAKTLANKTELANNNAGTGVSA